MKKETKEIKRKYRVNVKLIRKIVKWIMYIIMFILIYQLSPKLTYLIKNITNWINELDDELISRFIVISITILLMFLINKPKKKEVKNNGEINNRTSSY